MKTVNLEQIQAGINLHAVLRCLSDLSALDDDAKALLNGHRLSIGFSVPGIDPLTLDVGQGRVAARRARAQGGLKLAFLSPRHFNGMVAGTKMPLPVGGFRHLGFLQNNFAALAKRLEGYLRPREEDLKDAAFREKSTRLTAAVAMYALSEVGNLDPVGQQIARDMGDGVAVIEVPQVLSYALTAREGRLSTALYGGQAAHAFMRFDTIDTLGQAMRGELDSYLSIGRGQIAVSGRIPMLDDINKLLRMVSFYLA